jgi:hypothetical protein
MVLLIFTLRTYVKGIADKAIRKKRNRFEKRRNGFEKLYKSG